MPEGTKSSHRRLRTIGFLGRDTGLSVLENVLLADPRIEPIAVFTHGHLTRAEGGGPRPEVPYYRQLCEHAGIPLHILDLPQARTPEDFLPDGALDLMMVLSWKFLIPDTCLSRFCFGGINLHRGALPDYAGLEPVRRAIEAGEKRIAITAHGMTGDLDGGPELARVWLDLEPRDAPSVDVIKDRLLPLYAPLAGLAVSAVIEGMDR
ncbi:formyltransferase family protein [Thalassospiraceae bacterium LMO-JJ14]|nr:formyltransferase family protein [Thalassospiraceae bacterium LMO-JJ14]